MYGNFEEIRRNFIWFESTGSTNNDIKKIIRNSSAPVFDVICAGYQTEGRGRLGRNFFSPDGGLYFSVAVPLSGKEKNIPFMTLLAGLCVSEAINELCGVKTMIKWPNDIYLDGKKLGGILCELVSGNIITAVAGVGINLSIKQEDIPRDLRDIMTSLAVGNIIPPQKDALVEKIVGKLDAYIYEHKELFSVREETLKAIKERSFSIGKNVKYILGNEVIEGVVTDIKVSGAAEILLPDSTKKEIFCGEITQ